ncbi:MAG: hypothetical protein IJJ99_03095 [Oscillospiraceae bacterium]|nr:hypothetical protein [Oscillospiraceae bacterium]
MTTKIPHIIHVDLQSHAKRQIVYMKQGDEMSRELLIFFYNGGAVWAVPNEITSVSLSYCKADKVHGCYDHIADEVAYVFNSGRTSVTMAIHPQVLTAAGNVVCELKLCNAAGHALNTFNFVINCEQSPHAMGQQSEGYWNNVFDGATFTPHVSSDGILSWTNDKGLPNPEPVNIAIYGWVIPEEGVPVQTMEIVTSENVEENIDADDKIMTPAAAQVLIGINCPPPIQLLTEYTVSGATPWTDNSTTSVKGDFITKDGALYICTAPSSSAGAWSSRKGNYKRVSYSLAIREFSTSAVCNTGDFCYKAASGSYDPRLLVCIADNTTGAFDATKWQDVGPVFTVDSVDFNNYATALAFGTAVADLGGEYLRQAQYSESLKYVAFRNQNSYGSALIYVFYKTDGTVDKTRYSSLPYATV